MHVAAKEEVGVKMRQHDPKRAIRQSPSDRRNDVAGLEINHTLGPRRTRFPCDNRKPLTQPSRA